MGRLGGIYMRDFYRRRAYGALDRNAWPSISMQGAIRGANSR